MVQHQLQTVGLARVVGQDISVPILDGSTRRYVNLDNAASTPPMQAVQEAVNRFMLHYSSVHRGTGFKSQLSTRLYEDARHTVLRFLGADPAEHVCIFGKNTTEAINKLARRFLFSTGRNVVLVSSMEHHSNDLPWRGVGEVVHIQVLPDGRLDEADYDRKLQQYAGRVALVSITGASNVTGYINHIHRLAEKAHACGVQFAADCAQLAPHRKINMLPLADPAHLDYVMISGHKMYAPYGGGALVGRRDTFEQGDPDMRGGGQVEIVTEDDVVWSEPPDRDEAGSPNTVGAFAMAAAIRQLEMIGMGKVAAHEAELTAYALEKLAGVKGITIYGDPDPKNTASRVGVIPFNLQGFSHYQVAAILGYEFGIGVRNGCFCAHPYLLKLMGVSAQDAEHIRSNMRRGDKSEVPGLVRISFGIYNTTEDVDCVVEAFHAIADRKFHGRYHQEPGSGQFIPEGWKVDLEDYFPYA